MNENKRRIRYRKVFTKSYIEYTCLISMGYVHWEVGTTCVIEESQIQNAGKVIEKLNTEEINHE